MTKRLCFVLFGTISINAAIAQCNASFTPSLNPVCQGQPVTFTDFSSGGVGPFSYNWTFGAGAVPATSTLQNPPPVTYTTAGVKTITLTYTAAGGGGCTSTVSQAITVVANPIATFVSNAPQCEGSAVNFTNTGTSGAGITYTWDFGADANPGTSNAESPSGVTYSTSGTKLITFTVSNGYCSTVDTMSIAIKATPTSSFSSSAPQCTGAPVNFLCTGTTVGVKFAWNFGVGAVPAISAAQNPAGVTYTSPGVKTVTLVITNTVTGCIAVSSQTINIYQTPTATFTSSAPQCEGSAVNFTNTGTTGAGVTYNWDFGSGANPPVSASENPAGVVYSTPGTKLVTFTVNNGTCLAVDTMSITINAAPVASFTSNAPQCMGASVNFTNTGSAAGVTYSWNFGPNAVPAISAAQNPAGIIFTTAGPQTVTLTVTNTLTGCVATSTQIININQTPTGTFVSNAPQCVGNSVNFTNTGTTGAGVTYSWDFGKDATPQNSNAESPLGIVYSTPGSKLVTFTVSDGSCIMVDTMSIVIDSTPVASYTSNAPKCTGDSVSFISTGSSSGVTYSWNFGPNGMPNTSTLPNPNVAFSTSGPQTITYTVTDFTSGCSVTISRIININATPVATFTTNAPQCAGNSINFTNTGSTGAGVTYRWDFGMDASPATSNAESPVDIVYSTGGNKLITFTVNNGSCTKVDTMTIAIDSLPVAMAGNDTTICANDSVPLGVVPIAGNTYSWFPASSLSNANISNPVARPIAPTTNYILTVTSPTGCVSHDTVVVTMLAPLVANAGPPESICRFDSVQIGALPVNGQSYSWSPNKGLNNANLASPLASPDSTTTYTLTVTGFSCSPATSKVTITVHQLPMINAGPDDTIAKGASVQLIATGGVEYTWTPTSGLSNPGLYDPMANPDSTTTYIVAATDVFGCINRDTITVHVITENVWAPTAFTPNGDGKDDIFYIHGTDIQNFDFGVYDRWGEQIFHSQNIYQGWDGRRQITRETMPDGAYVYYVKGTLPNGQVVNMQGIVNLIR